MIKKHGDLHDFMKWLARILTDSGGSASLGAMQDQGEGVDLRSQDVMGPEESMQVQRDLGLTNRDDKRVHAVLRPMEDVARISWNCRCVGPSAEKRPWR